MLQAAESHLHADCDLETASVLADPVKFYTASNQIYYLLKECL